MADDRKLSILEPESENRDPNAINTHSVVTFYEVLGEPDDMHSLDFTWFNANKIFDFGFNWCYKLLALICAFPLALFWGLQFACVGFFHVWSMTPFIQCMHMNMMAIQRLFSLCVHCMCDPLWESVALIGSHIKVSVAKPE